jgi:hypothetical protein
VLKASKQLKRAATNSKLSLLTKTLSRELSLVKTIKSFKKLFFADYAASMPHTYMYM